MQSGIRLNNSGANQTSPLLRLVPNQLKAREALRLHEVHTFINDIKYKDECTAIDALNEAMGRSEGS